VLYATFITVSSKYGLGDHIVDVSPSDFRGLEKYLLFAGFFMVVGLGISKTSFAITLLGLVQRRWEKIFIWFVIISVNVALLLCAISLFAYCSPVEKNWDRSIPGVCWDQRIQMSYATFATC